MSAPTEAEIRAAIVENVDPDSDDVAEWIVRATRPIADSDMARVRQPWVEEFYAGDDHPGTLWADLTRAEADELQDGIRQLQRGVMRRAAEILVEECVAFGVAFGKAHPDIPRGHWQSRAKEKVTA